MKESVSVLKTPTKALEKSLINVCDLCFTEGLSKSLSKEDVYWIDVARAEAKGDLDIEATKSAQSKYDALFKTCSERVLGAVDFAAQQK